jgi:hypothetical protein
MMWWGVLPDEPLERAYCAFEPEDLLNAFPLLPEPVIEIGAAYDVAMFQPFTRFVPAYINLLAAGTPGSHEAHFMQCFQ